MSTNLKDIPSENVRKYSSNDRDQTPQHSQNSKTLTHSNFTRSKEEEKLNSDNSFIYNKKKEKIIKNKNPFEFNYTFEEIFKIENITDILNNEEPKHAMYKFIYLKYNKKKGEEIQTNIIKAVSDFHLQNLYFLKENFANFPNEIICKLLNILANLLVLNEEDYNINYTSDNETVTKKKKNTTDSEQENGEIKKTPQVPEPDISYLANRKLMEMKLSLVKLGLFPSKKNLQNKNDNNFYLNSQELETIMNYLNLFFFPNIRLYYHFINIKRINETKKIVILVDRPLPIPALSESVQVIERKDTEDYEDISDDKIVNEDNIINQQISNDNIYHSTNNLNNEVLKIVTEKCEEIKKDVDAKIQENTKEVVKVLEVAKEQQNTKKK